MLLEDLRSANGTRVNGVRITEQVPLSDADLVRIGDYGVALRPDGVPLENPCRRTSARAPAACPGRTCSRTPRLTRWSPVPWWPVEKVPSWTRPAPRSRRAPVVVGLGLLLGLGAPSLLRARDGDSARVRSAVPPPPTPEVVAEHPASLGGRAAAARAHPTDGAPRSRPSTATEWLAAARAAAEARDFERALRLLASVAVTTPTRPRRRPCAGPGGPRHAAGRAVRGARRELDLGRPSARAAAPGARPYQSRLGSGGVRAPGRGRPPRSRPPPGRPPSADRQRRATSSASTARERCCTTPATWARQRVLRALPHARPKPRPVSPAARHLLRPGWGHRPRREPLPPVPRSGSAFDDPAVPRVKKFLEDSDAQKKARASSAMPQR